ncbi:MAG TPA: hypothetical protein VF041_08525 [Gemmatimonadaceae bacterium]
MQRSKALALVFLVGTLVVGGALGFTADRLLVKDPCPSSDRQAMRESLAERLGLTPAQRAAVDSILDKRHRDMKAVIDPALVPVRPELDSIRLAARAEIFKLLDARQKPILQQMIDEQKRQKDERK